MYSEDDLVPISALQHVLFCERQYALIHLEQVWEENRFTAEGKVLHERVDAEHHESRRLFRQEYGMAVRSLERGLIGKCDLVELYLSPGEGWLRRCRWSLSGAKIRKRTWTAFSSAHRPSVWKRCSECRWWSVSCTISRNTGGQPLTSMAR